MRACPTCFSTFTSQVDFCGLDGTQLVESDVDPLLGRTLDRYRIVELLGRGGMASVYLAEHVELQRQVAFKILLGDVAADSRLAERFRREAKSIAQIRHPNVVMVSDYGTTEAGLTFLVMDVIDGCSLADAIDSGRFDPARAAAIAKQLAAGLGAAHALGFVHRDLKPGNVMLSVEDGVEVAQILDFGLVRVIAEDSEASDRLTKTGTTMGTPYYMAPEQVRGHECTSVSDLYALGAVLFEMLTGEPPFTGNMTEVLFKHATEAPPTLDGAYGLEHLVQALLAKAPADRPRGAREVIDVIDGLSFDAPPTGAALKSAAMVSAAVAPTQADAPVSITTASPPDRRVWIAAALLLTAAVMAAVWWLAPNTVDVVHLPVEANATAPKVDAPANAEVPAKVDAPANAEVPAKVDAPPKAEVPSKVEAPAKVDAPTDEPAAELDEKRKRRAKRKRRRAKRKAAKIAAAAEAPETRAPSISDSMTRIRAALAKIGLVPNDARRIDALSAAMSAFASARSADDRAAAKAAADALIESAKALPLPDALVQAKLQSALSQLSKKPIPDADLRALENEWFALQARASKVGADRDARAKLLREIASFRRKATAAAKR